MSLSFFCSSLEAFVLQDIPLNVFVTFLFHIKQDTMSMLLNYLINELSLMEVFHKVITFTVIVSYSH